MRFSGLLLLISLLFTFSIQENKGAVNLVPAVTYALDNATITTQEYPGGLPVTLEKAKTHNDPFICGTRAHVKTVSPGTDRIDLAGSIPSFFTFYLQPVYSSTAVIYASRENLFSFLQSLLYPKHSFW